MIQSKSKSKSKSKKGIPRRSALFRAVLLLYGIALFPGCKQAGSLLPPFVDDTPGTGSGSGSGGGSGNGNGSGDSAKEDPDNTWDPWGPPAETPSGEDPEDLEDPEDPEEPPPVPGFFLTITIPPGITLTAESYAQISAGDLEATLNTQSRAAESDSKKYPITESITKMEVHVSPGRYTLEVYLVEKTGRVYHDTAVLTIDELDRPENRDPLSFEPNISAFMTQGDYDSLAASILLRPTTVNSAGLKTVSTGGGGGSWTRGLALGPGVEAAYFVVFRKAAQTIAVTGTNASEVTTTTDPVDGESPGPTGKQGEVKDIYRVDSSSIAAGGTLKFTLNVWELEKKEVTYAVTLTLPRLWSLAAHTRRLNAQGTFTNQQFFYHQFTYVVGEAFNHKSFSITSTYSDGSTRSETVYDAVGFDSTVPGTCEVQLKKNGLLAAFSRGATYPPEVNNTTHTITLTVVEQTPAHLFFDYGYRISEVEPVPGRYTVTQGRPLVIAPILWRIPQGANLQWSVSGTSTYTATGEYLTFTDTTPVGEYTATVTASGGGLASQVSASTRVECVDRNSTSASASTVTGMKGGRAPGDHLDYGGSLGSFGGFGIMKYSTSNSAGVDFLISGNAFAAWQEPGVVWVMKDENKNAVADDTWYELTGALDEYEPAGITRRYAVTYYKNHAWEDNLGNHGTNPSKYLPEWPDKVTFAGTLLSRDPQGSYYPLWGYVDTMYNTFDISNAIQVDGSPADLDHIDFVKVHTGEYSYTELFGERSTETGGVQSVWAASFSSSTAVSGGYLYRFVNKSGYEMTINIKDIADPYIVAAKGQTATTLDITLPQATAYYRYVGGNVTCTKSGNTLTFANAGDTDPL